MITSLTAFWKQMSEGETIHPLDRPVLDGKHHTFRTAEPPPAFIGDIERAPVIVLCSNGGWNKTTSSEFLSADNSPTKFVNRLHNSSVCDVSIVSPYYAKSNLARWLTDGSVALLNLIPYRSPELGNEPENASFAGVLPSSIFAANWINSVVMPQAKGGSKMVIMKRKIWLDFIFPMYQELLLDTQRRGPHVFRTTISDINTFLSARKTSR